MAPRFIERINRQSETLRTLFGDPQFDPPPYPSSESSRTTSMASSQFERSRPTAPPGYGQAAETVSCNNHTSSNKSSNEQWSIPDDSLILVTGSNSWMGTHIVDQLLSYGYRVRGTVRTAEKATRTSKFFEQRYGIGRFHAALVPDMAKQAAFDIVVRDCVSVIHVASVTTASSDPNEVITPSIAGAINALEAAARGACVKRFVYCSAIVAAVSPNRKANAELTSESWNMLDFDEAWAPPPYDPGRIAAVHASSKMQTEAAVWRWYGRRQPAFDLNTVLPATLSGRILHPELGKPSIISVTPSIDDSRLVAPPLTYAVDVEDAALLHVAALLLSDVRDQRVFATSVHQPTRSHSPVPPPRAWFPSHERTPSRQDLENDRQTLLEMEKAQELLRRMGRKGWHET